MVAPADAAPAEPGHRPGRLIVVGTPIGNLADLSPRAAAALVEADAVACEDTRRTATLLRHAGSRAPMLATHAHNEASRAGDVCRRVAAGQTIALVTDAGMPAVSDPGARIVDAALLAGLDVEVIPGASAATAALAAAGESGSEFAFVGFFPRRGRDRMALLDRLDPTGMVVVGFESPRRLPSLLADLAARDPDRRVTVARELTKRHEELVRGRASDLAERFAAAPKGEITVVLAPAASSGDPTSGAAEAIEVLLDSGLGPRAAADAASKLGLARRNAAYEAALALARRRRT